MRVQYSSTQSTGYANDVTEIMKSLPKTCQGFLMSATLSPELHNLKHVVLYSPAVLKLEEEDEDGGNVVGKGGEGNLMQFYLDLPGKDKFLVLYVFLKVSCWCNDSFKLLFIDESLYTCITVMFYSLNFSKARGSFSSTQSMVDTVSNSF